MLDGIDLGKHRQNNRENNQEHRCVSDILRNKHLAQADEDLASQRTGYFGHQAEHADRCHFHNHLDQAHHEDVTMLKEIGQRSLGLALGQGRNCNTGEDGKHDDLNRREVGQGGKEVIRDIADNAVQNADALSAVCLGRFFQMDAYARFDDIGPDQAAGASQCGCAGPVNDEADSDLFQFVQVCDTGDTTDYGAKHQGQDRHLQQPQEHGADCVGNICPVAVQRFQQEAEEQTDNHANQNLDGKTHVLLLFFLLFHKNLLFLFLRKSDSIFQTETSLPAFTICLLSCADRSIKSILFSYSIGA